MVRAFLFESQSGLAPNREVQLFPLSSGTILAMVGQSVDSLLHMKTRLWTGVGLIVCFVLMTISSRRPTPSAVQSAHPLSAPPQSLVTPPIHLPPLEQQPASDRPRRLRTSTETFWSVPVAERTFAEFQDWTRRYLAAPIAERAELESQGIRLAKHRREDLHAVIGSDPTRALELAVPFAVRRALPGLMQALLEERIDSRGDLAVLAALVQPGNESSVEPLYRTASLGDRTFRAFVYGRREGEPTRFDIPLHGIAIDDRFAVDENPVRRLEVAEIALLLRPPLDPTCAVSSAPATTFGTEEFLDLGGEIALVCSPAHAEHLNDQWVVAEAGGSSDKENGILPNSAATEGIKKLLAIRVDFSDLAGAAFNDARGATIVSNLNLFFANMSYGKTGFRPVGQGSLITQTLRMPKTAAVYGSGDAAVLRSDARAAARAAGIEPRDFDYDLICFGAVPGFGWAGLGYVGAPGAWIRANFDAAAGVIAHELGHNFGLNHANFWDTSDQSTIGAGTSVEYGDGFDTMGNAGAGKRHFNARYKNLLNWLPNAAVLAVTTNGLYQIAAHDEPTATGQRALRIVKNSATNYWVEFRQRYTNNTWLMNGVGLRWARSGTDNRQSLLLDTTPGSADGKNDSAIVMGRTFSDRVSGIHITPIRKLSTTPESVEIAVYKGAFTNNAPPKLTLAASTLSVALNAKVEFTASASDPDDPSESLAYDWDFNDNTFGKNQPTLTKQWATVGEYIVRCTVSDLKGATASASLVVRVGSPTTLRISGNVLREGQPVSGVRVYTSNTKSAWTDDQGTYVIAGLEKGTYTVKATADGLLFTRRGFNNPLNLQANRSDVDFEASPPGDLAHQILVPAGAVWRYLDDGSNQGTAWRNPSFNDSTWNRGGAQLGYGDDDVLTQLNFGPNEDNKFITYYFRHSFNVEDTSGFASLVLGVVRDDGAIVYLNNREVFRSNMPSGTVTYTTRAIASVGGANESTYYETDLDPGQLVEGTNVFAVEIHQHDGDSSDLSFNLQLTGLRPVASLAPELGVQYTESGQLELSWGELPNAILQSSTSTGNDAHWIPVTDAAIESVNGGKTAKIAVTPSSRFFRLILP